MINTKSLSWTSCSSQFVVENKEDIEDGFELLKGSIHQIFKTPSGEEGSDFLGLILQAIAESLKSEQDSGFNQCWQFIWQSDQQYTHNGKRANHEGRLAINYFVPGNQGA